MITSFLPKVFPIPNLNQTKRQIIKRILRTPPHHLYSIILDVNSYSKFLPYCKSSQIIRRTKCNTMFDASLKVGISDIPPLDWIEEEYVSRVHFQAPRIIEHLDNIIPQRRVDTSREWTVQAKSIESRLFTGLKSSWKLKEVLPSIQSQQPKDQSIDLWTSVEFQVEMSVDDPIINATLDQVLEKVAQQQVDAFEKRCKELPISVEQ